MKRESLSKWLSGLASFLLLAGVANSAYAYEVFDNDKLRFGTGAQASVNTQGNLEQPFYYDASLSNWYKLTYSNYPLNNAIGIDGDGTNEWNINGTIVQDGALTGQALDVSGFTITSGSKGYGTIVSTGTVTIGGKTMEMRNTYALGADKSFVKIVTRLTNTSGGAISNVRLWVGTQDDWVGTTDQPRKQRGNLVGGAFVALTNAADRAAALQISSGATGVLFYSTSDKAHTSVNSCCSFSNARNQNPATSSNDLTNDGSYALFVRMADLANGASEEFTWYYAAGELDDLGDIVGEVAEEAGPSNYAVTASAGTGGTISPASTNVAANATTAFTVTPNTGYSIASVSGCGGSLSGSTYTTGAITAVCAVSATFTLNTYSVTPSAGSGGSISPATVQTINHGSTTSFTVARNDPDAYVVVGGTCGASLSGNTVTTSAITGNCTVTVSFHEPLVSTDPDDEPYSGETTERGTDTTFNVAGGSGSISVNGAVVTRGGVDTALNNNDINTLLTSNGNGSYTFNADHTGRYEITFVDSGSGQEQTLTFTILPQVAFSSVQQPGTSGQQVQAVVLLDDEPVDYPVTVPYTAQGASLTTNLNASGTLTINSPSKSAVMAFTPNTSNGEIVLTLAANGLTNAVLGGLKTHKVTLASQALIPLQASLSLLQGASTETVVTQTGGNVAISVTPNGGGYSFDWSRSSIDLGIHAATGSSVNINPTLLDGIYPVHVTVTETGGARRTATATFNLRVTAAVPAAYNNFYDNDYADDPQLLAICPAGGLDRVADCENVAEPVYLAVPEGYTLKLGRTSEQASWESNEYGIAVEAGDLRDENNLPAQNGDDRAFTHIGFSVDFEVSGLEYPGQSIPVVVPMPAGQAIPADAMWRKYTASAGWQDFVENEANTISSAPRTFSGECPWAGADDWTDGLNTGDECLRIVIEDGGPNDEDRAADGVIRDPGTLAVPLGGAVLKSGSGGGGSLEWMTLIVLLMTLTLRYRRIVPATAAMLAMVISFNTRADDQWYVGVGAGQAMTSADSASVTSRMNTNGIPGSADVSNQNRGAWKVFGGYQWKEHLAIEAGYVDLGEITTRFSGAGNVTLNELRDIRPTSGTGFEFAFVGSHDFSERFAGYGRLGLLRWKAGYELTGVNNTESSVEPKGTDLTFGLGIDAKLGGNWVARAAWDRYEVDGDESHLFALGVIRKLEFSGF